MSSTLINPVPSKDADRLLNTNEASAYIGVLPGTLEVWRCTKRYPIPFIKVGRLVKYRKSDLDNFLIERTVDGRGN